MFGMELLKVDDDGSGKNCERCVFANEFGECMVGLKVDRKMKRPCEEYCGDQKRHFVNINE